MDDLSRRLFLVKREVCDKDQNAEAQARLDDTGTIRRYLRLADQLLQDDEATVDNVSSRTPVA